MGLWWYKLTIINRGNKIMKTILKTYKIELNNSLDTNIDTMTMNVKAENKNDALAYYQGFMKGLYNLNIIKAELVAIQVS
jgi:hypothetical protein